MCTCVSLCTNFVCALTCCCAPIFSMGRLGVCCAGSSWVRVTVPTAATNDDPSAGAVSGTLERSPSRSLHHVTMSPLGHKPRGDSIVRCVCVDVITAACSDCPLVALKYVLVCLVSSSTPPPSYPPLVSRLHCPPSATRLQLIGLSRSRPLSGSVWTQRWMPTGRSV